MRWIAMLMGIALLAGCLGPKTESCGDTGFLCPAGLVCAAPGHCGEERLVDLCRSAEEWTPCPFDNGVPESGSCHNGICGACDANRAGCNLGWGAMVSGISVDLNAVWVVDSEDVYVAGDGGTLLHYDGIAWTSVMTTPPAPTAAYLSIWGSGPDDFYIVTDDMTQGLLHVVDRTQLTTESSSGYYLKAVSGTTANDVYVAGYILGQNGGRVRHFDGAGWRDVFSDGLPLRYIDVASPTRVIAVGPSGDFARLEGTAWSRGNVGTNGMPEITGVWTDDSNAVVVGNLGTVLALTATNTWQPGTVDLSLPVDLALSGVWGTAGDVYAVSLQGKIIHSTNGIDWTNATPDLGSATLTSIDGTGPDTIFVVGSAGTIWRYSSR